ncbi:hypothetical protein JCM3766R1_000834 [Sporobolomyces carnicolor]
MAPRSTVANSTSSAPPVLPRDARLIALLLAANGAEDCEEGVVRMLVEFAHRYTSDILTDSLLYAEHARAGNTASGGAGAGNNNTTTNSTSGASNANLPLTPSIDDIRLAVQARTESASVPKEFLLQLATQVNSVPLPPVPEVYGIRLPPAAQRLTAPNFSIVPRSGPPPTTTTTEGGGANELDGSQNLAGGGAEGDGGDGTQTAEGSEAGGGGLFGDDDDEDDDDEDDDEEMEDVTAGLGGSGSMSGGNGGGGSMMMPGVNGTKRKAGDSDEEYD